MDLLQSFMGCMYPGSIRTESVESMEHDYSDFRFQVRNIDERGNQVSEGELHLTDRDLIYFRPGKVPTRWPINSLRRYGSDRNAIFIFEAGRKSQMEGIFAFRLNRTIDLNKITNRIKEMLQELPTNAINTTTITNTTTTTTTTSTTTTIQQPPPNQEGADPRPLSYVLIDFEVTKALNESAQAHAANRQINKDPE